MGHRDYYIARSFTHEILLITVFQKLQCCLILKTLNITGYQIINLPVVPMRSESSITQAWHILRVQMEQTVLTVSEQGSKYAE
jgi:hypothetical protein